MKGSRKNTLARIQHKVSKLLAGELLNDVSEMHLRIDER